MSLLEKLKESEKKEFYIGSSVYLGANVIDYIGTSRTISKSMAITKTKTIIEANPIIRYSMDNFGVNESLAGFKLALPLMVILGTKYVISKRKNYGKLMNRVMLYGGILTGIAGAIGFIN